MAMTNLEKSKFKFSETFNNSDGKTSGSAFVGVILGIIVALSWIAGTAAMYMMQRFSLNMDILSMYFNNTLALGGTSALLLGARKIVSSLANKRK